MLLAFLVACPAFQPFDADREIHTRDPQEDPVEVAGEDTAEEAAHAAVVEAFYDAFFTLVCDRTWTCEAEDMSTVSDFPDEAACVASYDDVEIPDCPHFNETAAAACLATYEAWTCPQVREDYLPNACARVCLGS